EVLKVISRSTFDLEPVLERLIENATRLSGADRGIIFRLDEEIFRAAAAFNTPPEVRDVVERTPIHPGRDTLVGRVALARQVVLIPDTVTDAEYRHPSRDAGVRTVLGVPMFREETLIGVIAIWSSEVRSFSD